MTSVAPANLTPLNVIDWASGVNAPKKIGFVGVEGKRYENTAYLAAFHKKFITSTEIATQLKLPKATLAYARQRGSLPGYHYLPGVCPIVWEREKLIPYLLSWELTISTRRANK